MKREMFLPLLFDVGDLISVASLTLFPAELFGTLGVILFGFKRSQVKFSLENDSLLLTALGYAEAVEDLTLSLDD